MKLSIITVNYRSWGHLESSLDALRDDFPDNWEFIVVDNESNPHDLGEFAGRHPWVKFIANPINSGFAHGCNLGAAEATGDALLFMNPDVVAQTADLQTLMQLKADNDIGIAAPGQLSAKGKVQKVFDDFPSLLNQSKSVKALLRLINPSAFPDPRAAYSDIWYCDWVTGSVLMIDRKDFDAIGGWTEDYWMYAEDADICRKARNKGLTVAFVPQVSVIHAHGGSSRINVAVKAMTKLEVIISKHVYASKHNRGLAKWLNHMLIIVLRLPVLLIAAILDLLTLSRIPALRVKRYILQGLLRYYAGVVRTGSWLSPRAVANQHPTK